MMNESEILKTLENYVLDTAYGRAMLEAHSLELCLANLLVLRLVDDGYSGEKYKSEFEKIKKKTMGRLISEVVEKYEISDFWQEELDNCLFFRNRLTHQISDDVVSLHINGDGKEKLVTELEEIKGYFIETKVELDKMVDLWLDKKGIDRSIIHDAAMSLVGKGLEKRNALLQE